MPRARSAAAVAVAVAAGAAALGAAFASASPASAAAIVTGAACYRDDSDVSIAGQGFSPGSLVTLTGTGIGGRSFADSEGNVQMTAVAQPFRGRGPNVRAVVLTATDGTVTAQTTVRVTNFTFSITPTARRPRTLVHWAISGFDDGAPVYAHYVHAGREQRRILFGQMPTPCSILRARVPMLPIRVPDPGRWIIQLDNAERYSPTTLPRLRLTGTIRPS
jgi:hypothetical protein